MRFTDFLRVSVLLFGGAGTALAAVAVAGATRDDDTVLLLAAVGWWALAVVAGLWLGRKMTASPGIARVLANARKTSTLPELEPGAVLFNRLWPLALITVAAGGVAFLVPQVPAIAAGYALGAALAWRKQTYAVQAIEERDGVQFWFDRSSPFGPPQLLRLPGLRKIAPEPETERASASAPS
jgi:hypothetical protein